MKTFWVTIGVVLLLTVVLYFIITANRGEDPRVPADQYTATGIVLLVEESTGEVLLQTFEEDVSVLVDSNTRMYSGTRDITLGEVGVGDEVYVRGKIQDDGSIRAESLSILDPDDEEVSVSNNIDVVSPEPSEVISSPLTLQGSARLWYFEATFPVRLLNAEGQEIAQGYAEATSDWMTEEPVDFVGTLTWDAGDAVVGTEGILILEKANPSGDPERNEEVRIPVVFGGSEE